MKLEKPACLHVNMCVYEQCPRKQLQALFI